MTAQLQEIRTLADAGATGDPERLIDLLSDRTAAIRRAAAIAFAQLKDPRGRGALEATLA